ncbi:MAG: B12-binding domain-containing radical SAM protein [Actinomycetes bacterium]
MKVTFVSLGQEQLAIGLLSAVLKREGHTTSLAFHPALFDYDGFLDIPPLARALDTTERVVQQVVDEQPDLVAFSVLTAAYQWSLYVATRIKEQLDVPVIFGGVHPSAVPAVCLEQSCVDYVCVGEGETALVELCAQLPLATATDRPTAPIPNLWWRDGDRIVEGPAAPFLADLDSLPHWDKTLWEPHVRLADQWMTMSSRGCPYRCTFCFNNFFAKIPGRGGGKYLRQRSVDHMMSELVDAKATYGIRRIDFEDDIFTVDKQWLQTFLAEYRREINLPFQCLVHPRFVDDDIARWLKDAGCEHVQMGVQSVDETYKRQQLLRMESDAHTRSALASLSRANLDLKLDHMLGLPNEPISAQELARELYTEFPPRRIQTFWLVHLPGVELTTSSVGTNELSVDEYERLIRGEARKYHAEKSDRSAEAATYRKYELLFRMLTVLPRFLQRRLRVERLPALPPTLNHAVGLGFEAANALRYRDRETLNYVRYYLHHLPRLVRLAVRDRLRAVRHRQPLPTRVTVGSTGMSPSAPPVARNNAAIPSTTVELRPGPTGGGD